MDYTAVHIPPRLKGMKELDLPRAVALKIHRLCGRHELAPSKVVNDAIRLGLHSFENLNTVSPASEDRQQGTAQSQK